MRIIGLAGYKNAGKDLAYGFIAGATDRRCRRVAFADPMKLATAHAFGWQGEKHELIARVNELKEEGWVEAWASTQQLTGCGALANVHGRDFVVNLGQGLRKTLGQDVWLDWVLPPVSKPVLESAYYPDTDLLVVTDVRFANEATRIKEFKGEVWRINRVPKHAQDDGGDFYLPDRYVDSELYNHGSQVEFKFVIQDRLQEFLG